VYLDLYIGSNGQAKCEDKQKLGSIYTEIKDHRLQNLAPKSGSRYWKKLATKWVQAAPKKWTRYYDKIGAKNKGNASGSKAQGAKGWYTKRTLRNKRWMSGYKAEISRKLKGETVNIKGVRAAIGSYKVGTIYG